MMEYVITRLCRDCVDGSCLTVCPVECILQHDGQGQPNQLFIEPEICIGCGACEAECPWEAIFIIDDVPRLFVEDIAINRRTVDYPEEYSVPDVGAFLAAEVPTGAEVRAHRARWEQVEQGNSSQVA